MKYRSSKINFEFDVKAEKCIVCTSSDIKDYFVDHNGISISKCNVCAFEFMNPQYSDKYLEEYYSTYMESEDFSHWHEALLYGHNFYFSLIEKHTSPGKALDIGCGNGHLLEVALNRGWSVHGYDVDKTSTQNVARRLNIEVDYGDLFSSNIKSGFDLVTMHQVLEHLKDPNKYLEYIYKLINNDGYLFVAVPNIKSLSNRMKHFLERVGIRRKNVGKYYATGHHVLYFEPKTLVNLLEQHGFKVVLQRNCHSSRPNQSRLTRFLMRNITDHFFKKGTFLVIAKKV
ncbi:MAG: class I SAM-dependent methyltransferase [Ghiorsea sp.]|nr:class I SAM-dependent methyltransferase [Ghiorsea sp.]